MADVWFGGGADAFIAAKDEGLLEAYIYHLKLKPLILCIKTKMDTGMVGIW